MSAPASPERNQKGVPEEWYFREWGQVVDPPAAYRHVLKMPGLPIRVTIMPAEASDELTSQVMMGMVVDCGVIANWRHSSSSGTAWGSV